MGQTEATPSQTVTELAVRKYLGKSDLSAILEKSGRSPSGPKDELADRVLADSTLSLDEVFGRMSEEDMRKLLRDLDLPLPAKKSFFQMDAKDMLIGEKGRLQAHLVDLGKKQGWAPKPKPAATASDSALSDAERTAVATAPAPPQIRVPDHVVAAPTPSHSAPAASSGPAPPLASQPDVGQFDDLCKFLDSYTFTKHWDEEINYEAELAGAISGHFRSQKVVHQMAVGGTRADLVACGAVIEIKYPKTRQPLQTLTGQVEGYQKLFGNRVIVVLCTGGLRDTQAFNDSAGSLTERGAKVYIK